METYDSENYPGLTVLNCGYEKCDPKHFYGPAVRDHYLIHFLVSGKGEFISGDRRYPIKKNDGFLIEPSKVTTYIADPIDPYEYYWVGFNGRGASSILSLCDLDSASPVFTYEDHDKLIIYLKSIYESSADPISGEYSMLGNLYLILSCLMQRSDSMKQRISEQDTILEKALRFMQSNYSRRITVQHTADHVNIDRSSLFRIFVKGLGISPQQYLIELRMNKARSLLEKYSLSVSQTAYSTGYTDPAHFSRVFKNKFGISPKDHCKNKTRIS